MGFRDRVGLGGDGGDSRILRRGYDADDGDERPDDGRGGDDCRRGANSIPGAALGGLLLGLAQHLGVWKIPSEWQDSIAFAVLLMFLLVRPQGILGRKA